jgi:hypothetical protein
MDSERTGELVIRLAGGAVPVVLLVDHTSGSGPWLSR